MHQALLHLTNVYWDLPGIDLPGYVTSINTNILFDTII